MCEGKKIYHEPNQTDIGIYMHIDNHDCYVLLRFAVSLLSLVGGGWKLLKGSPLPLWGGGGPEWSSGGPPPRPHSLPRPLNPLMGGRWSCDIVSASSSGVQ